MADIWKLVRVIGFVVLALLATVTFVAMGPKSTETPDRSAEIAAALSSEAKNASSASSAPQQQVVNGWIARDLLVIQSYTVNDQLAVTKAGNEASHQIAKLLFLAVLAICWGGATSKLGGAKKLNDSEASAEPSGEKATSADVESVVAAE